MLEPYTIKKDIGLNSIQTMLSGVSNLMHTHQ